jgi:hypothetical protein
MSMEVEFLHLCRIYFYQTVLDRLVLIVILYDYDKEKQMKWDTITVRNIGREKRNLFRFLVLDRGYTMRDSVIWFIDQLLEKKIELPKRD